MLVRLDGGREADQTMWLVTDWLRRKGYVL
jgi:hypothetical protein